MASVLPFPTYRKLKHSPIHQNGVEIYSGKQERSLQHRILLFVRQRPLRASLAVLVAVFFFFLTFKKGLSIYMTNLPWKFAPIMHISRKCPAPNYATVTAPQRICLATLTDTKSSTWIHRFIRWRNFDQVGVMSVQNKQAYAARHGYTFFDGSHLLYAGRPPAWSKILVMQHLLQQTGVQTCDWVMWMDADVVIMNMTIRMESFLPATYDMLVTSDLPNTGWNAGVIMVRNSEWSKQFLQDWWNMTSYVRPAGFSLSGDNNALKALLSDMPSLHPHVLVPARCTFNSFTMFVQTEARNFQQEDWYLSTNFYHQGDFVAHVAGYDNKLDTVRLLFEESQRLNGGRA